MDREGQQIQVIQTDGKVWPAFVPRNKNIQSFIQIFYPHIVTQGAEYSECGIYEDGMWTSLHGKTVFLPANAQCTTREDLEFEYRFLYPRDFR